MHRAVVHGTPHISRKLWSATRPRYLLAVWCLHNSKISCAEAGRTRAATHIHDMWLGAHWGSGEYSLHHVCEKKHTHNQQTSPICLVLLATRCSGLTLEMDNVGHHGHLFAFWARNCSHWAVPISVCSKPEGRL